MAGVGVVLPPPPLEPEPELPTEHPPTNPRTANETSDAKKRAKWAVQPYDDAEYLTKRGAFQKLLNGLELYHHISSSAF